MVRLYLLMGVVVAAFYIFSIVDCALHDRVAVRALPKPVWVLVVVIPLIGGGLWFTFGRRRLPEAEPPRELGPDDDPEFLGSLGTTTSRKDEGLQARIHELEDELSDLDKKEHRDNGKRPGQKDA